MSAARHLLLALCLAACGGEASAPADAAVDAQPDAPVDAAPACTVALWDPASTSIDQWPDPRVEQRDPATPTGARLRVDPARFATTLRAAGAFSTLLTDLDDLDGFGVNAQAFFRFGRAFDGMRLPTPEATRTPAGGAGFVVLSTPPRLEGAVVTTADEGATLVLAPLRPLPPGARVAAFVTRGLTAAAGGCLEPSAATRRELAEPGEGTAAALAALRAVGVTASREWVVSLTVFTTQSTTRESQAVAADIAARDFTVAARRPCANDPMGRFRRCEFDFVAGNYLDARTHLAPLAGGAARPQRTYTLSVTAWLPTARAATPLRTLLYGHGLGGDRSQGERLASFAAPMGIATVALDAVSHGTHPLNPTPGSSTLPTVIQFFSLNFDAEHPFDARAIRDRFRQSAWDKLQLTRLLQRGVDVDGDGAVDLDPARLAYLGVSLGGIMGPELLSLTDAYGAAVLVVPGGRVSAIISESATFAPILRTFRPPGTTAGDVERAFPLLQTLLDRGDAASYAPHVLASRLTPGGARATPSVLAGVVLDDDTVPNASNYTLVRALDLPILPPLLRPAPGVATAPASPLSANAAMGRATAAAIQFDVVGGANGQSVRATHSNVGASDVGAHAWLHFLTTHWSRGVAEAADPYRALGRAHGTP